jgi:MATE family multidrug resistance protein
MTSLPEAGPTHRNPNRPGSHREVLLLAYPAVLTQLSETLMGVVDSAMVGRLGPTELGAVGFGAVWMWTIFALLYGTASGVQIFVSQAGGADRSRDCGAWAWQGIYALVPAAVVFVAALLLAAKPLLALLGPSPELSALAADYIQTRVAGEFAYVVLMVLIAFFHGTGDTRTPLYVTLFANAVNLVLDYGLIFGHFGLPAWGVAGAGTATSVAAWSGSAVLFVLFRRRSLSERFDTNPKAPNRSQIRRLVKTGAPVGGQWCIGTASFAVFATVVARMGDTSMAASQAFNLLLSLSYMQAIGIGTASSTLVGRYVGAGDPQAANQSFRSALLLGLAVALIIALLFVTIPVPLLRIFSNDLAVIELGRPLLLLGAIFVLFDTVAIISEGSLRGGGDTRWPFLLEAALGWGLLIPLAYILGVTLEGGVRGAWIGALIHMTVLSAALFWRFRSNAWQRIRI